MAIILARRDDWFARGDEPGTWWLADEPVRRARPRAIATGAMCRALKCEDPAMLHGWCRPHNREAVRIQSANRVGVADWS